MGTVVMYFDMTYRDKDNILDQKYAEQIFWDFF